MVAPVVISTFRSGGACKQDSRTKQTRRSKFLSTSMLAIGGHQITAVLHLEVKALDEGDQHGLSDYGTI